MKKKFDAVKFQRKVREELSQRYLEDAEQLIKELKAHYSAQEGLFFIDKRSSTLSESE